MNPVGISNIAVMSIGITALGSAVELAKTSNYIGAGIAAIIGIAALWLYEHLPATPPTI